MCDYAVFDSDRRLAGQCDHDGITKRELISSIEAICRRRINGVASHRESLVRDIHMQASHGRGQFAGECLGTPF